MSTVFLPFSLYDRLWTYRTTLSTWVQRISNIKIHRYPLSSLDVIDLMYLIQDSVNIQDTDYPWFFTECYRTRDGWWPGKESRDGYTSGTKGTLGLGKRRDERYRSLLSGDYHPHPLHRPSPLIEVYTYSHCTEPRKDSFLSNSVRIRKEELQYQLMSLF